MSDRPRKSIERSRVTIHQLMLPEHANAWGKVHGGLIMKMVDEAGGICAMRHAQRPAVTLSMDSMTFLSPVHVGDVLCCAASVNRVGRSSMEVGVKVHAENPITGMVTHTNSAYMVYVALGEDGRPSLVPELELVTEEDQRRWREAEERHRLRLERERA